MKRCFLTAAVLAASAAFADAQAAGRAEWMRGSFGLSVHWTAQCALEDGSQIPFEEAVDRFDVERFADALESVGARHCIFTIAHGLQKMPCPNAALDAIDPGRTTKRDLVGELIAALGRRGIRFIAYYNHSCNGNDKNGLVKAWKTKCACPCDNDGTGSMETFASNYCAIVSDLSRRYGKGISAWWFDSPYSVDTSGPHRACKGEWRFPWARLIAAARSGNPGGAVAINAGIGQHFQYAPGADYLAGEARDKDQAFTPAPPGLVDHRWMCVDSPAWVFSGRLAKANGGFVPLRYSPETLRDYVRIHTAAGRMVTFNVLVDQLGRLNPALCELAAPRRIDVPPQSFDAGGWALDAQFMDVMGSPYLLAHGLGVRVMDARACVKLPAPGRWRVWVRARNWADGAPGRFGVSVNGRPLAKIFGEGPREWAWEDGGVVELPAGTAEIALCDKTGFDGRCAGVVLSAPDEPPPKGALSPEALPVAETHHFDFVVVGGGLPGVAAAVAAARAGVKTALVQDRPVLGGNASAEIRVWCGGEARHPLVRELRGRFRNRNGMAALSDRTRERICADETNLVVFLSHRAFGVEKADDGAIAAVKALDLRRNAAVRFRAPLFCDATGDGWVGAWSGADFRMGREARGEYDESMAPEKADGDTLGASLMWTSVEANTDMPFSAPWAEPHAQGVTALNGEWNWEYGIHRDMIREGEEIRDRLFLAIYGAFSRAKRNPANSRRVLQFCPYLLGKRESRRLMGDWVLSEKDVAEKRPFPDAVATGSWSVDLHYDDFTNGVDFLTTCRQPHFGRYWIPYRSLYSRNVPNLFMAGRCLSATHVGLGSPRVINTLAQTGVAVGEAAAICTRLSCRPRAVWEGGHVHELQRWIGGDWPGNPDPAKADWRYVDDESDGVSFGPGWWQSFCNNGDQIGDKAHYGSQKSGQAVYPLPVEKAGRYRIYFNVPYHWNAKRPMRTAYEISSGGAVAEVAVDPVLRMGEWNELGVFDLAPGAVLRVIPSKSVGRVKIGRAHV